MNYYKVMIKRLYVAIAVLALTVAGTLTLNGQRQGQGLGPGAAQRDSERLTAYKIAFFTGHLDLTTAEAEKFWPLYNDFSARKAKLQSDRLLLIQYSIRNEANMDQQETSSSALKLIDSFSEEAGLTSNFNKELQKILTPSKIIRFYHVEHMYKQQLLNELNQRRQGAGPPARGRGGAAAGDGAPQ